jgi:hypothetical protein
MNKMFADREHRTGVTGWMSFPPTHTNPAPLRPRITLPEGTFPELCAKTPSF